MDAWSTAMDVAPGTDLTKDARYLPVARANGVARLLGLGLNTISLVSPRRAAALVNDLVWCRPRRPPRKPDDAAALAQAERIDVVAGEQVLRAYAWGRGPTVVLVHGWGGSAGQMSRMAVQLAARGLRVVAYDAPAHGDSSVKLTDFPTMTSALQRVVERVGGVQAVVAHSAGCVALLRAMRSGLRLQRVVLVSAFAQLALPLASLGFALGLSPRLQAHHIASLRQRFGSDFLETYSPEELVRDLATGGLIVHDNGDREFGVANALRIASQWPGAELFLTDGLGHYRILKDESVARRIGDSLAGLPAHP